MSFAEIEEMPLELLLDIEIVDSKVTAAFDSKRNGKRKTTGDKRQPFSGEKLFIDQIMNF